MSTDVPHNGAGGALLAAVADVLEQEPALADRFRRIFAGAASFLQREELLALKHTGVSVRTLRSAIAAGELSAVKVGRELRVRRADLEAWLAARAVKPRERQERALELSPAERAIERARRSGSLRVVGGVR